MPAKLSDGLFIAIDRNGEVCGPHQGGTKLYTYIGTAVKRAGKGGRVYRVDEGTVTLVWPEPKTFFLNERHELPPASSSRCSCGDDPCYRICCCGKSGCYMCTED